MSRDKPRWPRPRPVFGARGAEFPQDVRRTMRENAELRRANARLRHEVLLLKAGMRGR